MHHLLLQGFILSIIINTALVRGIIRSPCPKACYCDLQKGVLNCPYGYWNELPNIPAGTKQVRIKGGDFGTLQGPSSCQNYSEVTLLELVNNRIMSIEGNAFQCMSELQTLTSDRNIVLNIPNNTFDHVPNLLNFTLSRSFTDMTRIHKLCNLRKLQMLNLSFNNRYRVLDLRTLNCIGYLKDLSHVNLAFNNIIQSYPLNQTLQPLRNVSVYISLANCYIEALWDDTFSGFKVTILDLSFNRIQQIQRNTFTDLPNLTKLNLAGNQITEIREWLENLNSLLEIDLRLQTGVRPLWQSKNPTFDTLKREIYFQTFKHDSYPISSDLFGQYNVEENIFRKLQKLEILFLGYNEIALNRIKNLLLDIVHCPLTELSLSGIPLYILNNTFKDFYQNKLKRLYLQKCKIINILPRTFEHFHDLQELDLSHNEIMDLPTSAFQGLISLKTLAVHHNHIGYFDGELYDLNCPLSSLDVSNNEIVYMSLPDISTLKKVDLSHNTGAIGLYLKNVTRLSSLWLSSVKMFLSFDDIGVLGLHSQTQKQIWSNASQLRNLDISKCKIKNLVPRLFSTLVHLQVLNLSSNQIASIHQSAFQGASSVVELFLHNNNIRYINFATFLYTPYLRFISLANNPLVCTCDVLWIAQAIKTHDLVFMHNPDETVCYSPRNVIKIKN